MFTFLKSRSARAISAAVVSLNLGLGLASPTFAHMAHTANADFGLPAPDQGGELTFESLGAMLRSLNLSFNEVQDNGDTACQVNIPALNGNPAVTIMLAISPNKKYLNIWYVAGQLNQQDAPSQQVLLALLQANDKTAPSYIDIEGNVLVLRDNVRVTGVTADELMTQLKEFYGAIQKIHSVYSAPADNPSPAAPANPFE